jgi:hypothetical protein
MTATFAATFVRTAATSEAAFIITIPAHRSPAVTVVFIVVSAARTRSAFTHKAALFGALRGAAGIAPIVVIIISAPSGTTLFSILTHAFLLRCFVKPQRARVAFVPNSETAIAEVLRLANSSLH